MPVHYTESRKQKILEMLHIEPVNGRVTSGEAARILTRRARDEHKIEHIYTTNAVRKHKAKLNPAHPLKADGTENRQVNLYDIDLLFTVAIEPKRTNKGDVGRKIQGIDKVFST